MTNTQAPQESTSAVPSDRLWLRSELMGTQVITRDTGRRLGLVGEVVVDIDRREVVALGLRDNPLTRFLPVANRSLIEFTNMVQYGSTNLISAYLS